MRKAILSALITFSLISVQDLYAEPDEDFQTGVEQYTAGNYDSALVIFKSLEEKGYKNPELFYNLANCYFKTDQPGMAVANYLRAQKLDPRNVDIKSNLLFVRSTLRDKYQDSAQNPIWEFIKDSSLYFKADELTIFLFIIYLFLIGLLIFMIITKEKYLISLILVLACCFVLLLGGFMLGINVKLNYNTQYGVIVVPETEILSGPGASSDERFTAHEGLTFTILRQESGYYEGIFANKLKGWVEISKAYEF